MSPSTMRIRVGSAERPVSKARWLGFVGGLLPYLFRTSRPEITSADLRRQDYPTSTQRLGVRFTERIRRAFRGRWIREIF